MEYDFYQRIVPIDKLVKVGTAYVPDGRPSWLFAVKPEITAHLSYDPTTTPSEPLFEEIRYERRKTITGDIFVAEVNTKVK